LVTLPVNDSIVLRSYQPADAGALFDAVNANRAHLASWLSWVGHTTRQDHSLQFIHQSVHDAHVQTALALGIFENGSIIGGIGMHGWNHEVKKAQLGYWIIRSHEGKGIITDSLRCFVQFLFEKTGLNKVEIHFSPANKRSARVAERLGFRVEGILRQSILRNGLPDDVVVTGLLRSEWTR